MTIIMMLLKRALFVLFGVHAAAAFSSPSRLRTPSISYSSNRGLTVVPKFRVLSSLSSPSSPLYNHIPAEPSHQLHYQRKTTRLDSTSSLSLSEDAYKYDDTTAETSSSQTLTQATFSLIKAMVGSGLVRYFLRACQLL